MNNAANRGFMRVYFAIEKITLTSVVFGSVSESEQARPNSYKKEIVTSVR